MLTTAAMTEIEMPATAGACSTENDESEGFGGSLGWLDGVGVEVKVRVWVLLEQVKVWGPCKRGLIVVGGRGTNT